MEQSKTNQFNVLAEKPVGSLLMQYAIPAIVAMAASSVYNIIDGIFIGQGVGAEAIMGLALTGPLMSLTAAFGAMVGVGAATLMSVKLGQKDYGTAQKILGNVVIMNLTLGIVLGLLLLVFINPILRFFGASDVTLPYARNFMSIILVGNVVTHMYLGLNALLRSTNRPQKAMCATIGTVVLNCILAPIFIFVLGWGIRGAATATIMAQMIMLTWQLRLFSNKNELIHLNRSIIKLDVKIVKESLLVGLPQFLINLCACLVAAMMTRSLTTYGGDMAVGAFGICNRFILFIVMVVIGLNQGMQPIAGYNFGARRYDRVLGVLGKALIFGSVITLAGFVIGVFFPTPFVSVFAKDSPQLIKLSAHALSCMVMMFPIVGIQIVSTAFFQSIGYAPKSIFLSLTRQLIFLVPAIFILPHLYADPLEGLWHAAPVADGLASVLAITLLVLQVKKFKKQMQAPVENMHTPL
ncbi:MATE family efflux transporter [Prevotellamassilia timonensis]|uniref:MATE family efflux transporter n=1 Tax=Prevotellamassilia timonensis TaxID=1852370 RepID=UPI0023F49B1D|nr:MATE family efflux transporter [Prevotellamassilia timonensis]MDD7440849.1 MATE family efflux transporter [Prevotellamassilia timonensis]